MPFNSKVDRECVYPVERKVYLEEGEKGEKRRGSQQRTGHLYKMFRRKI